MSTDLAWEATGAGEPVLLVMGLSGSRRAWWRLLPHLEPRHRAIAFDNRGTGASPAVTGPLSMAGLATDALAVLDAAGHASAHVVGVSMGGMVAQHLALDHRARVRSLVLGCTTAGGGGGAPPWRLLAATAARPVLGAARTMGVLAPALYAAATLSDHPDRVAADLELRAADATDVRTTLAQMTAIARHDTRDRLDELAGLPVTVLHGEEDALVPVEAGRDLAAGIPGARLVTVPACGHLMTTDAEEETAAAVLAHLDAAAGNRAAA